MASSKLSRLFVLPASLSTRSWLKVSLKGSANNYSNAQVSVKPKKNRRFIRKSFLTLLTLITAYYGFKYIEKITRPSFKDEKKKKLIILGSGWGAMSVLTHLNPGQFEVTIVSPRNYFLFTPILPSVTVGTVESRSIVEPVRKLISKSHGRNPVQFYEAECMGVSHSEKKIYCRDNSGIQGTVSEFHLDYDILVTSIGAGNNTFNVPGVEENCYFLKEMTDAKIVRDAIIDIVESASFPGQPESEIKRLLHFVVVGGGPTGVEFASELRDFLREDIPTIYDHIKDHFKVTLVQSGDHILNTYDQQISDFSEHNFRKEDNNVEILTGTRVIGVEANKVTLMDKGTHEKYEVPCGLCLWSTGVAPRKLTKAMMEDIQNQKKGRALVTDGYLRVKGANGIFALGDCSTIEQNLMLSKAEQLFEMADVNKDGQLTLEEFVSLMEQAKYKFPQIQLFFSKAEKNVKKLFAEMDTSGDQVLDMGEFKNLLRTLDRELKSLPATAQVASQQGKYLGKLLSRTNGNGLIFQESIESLKDKGHYEFTYRHLGSFAYVGDNKAVLEVPIFGALNGWWVMWLWRAAYASECASTRTKVLLVTDWIKSYIFGRDTSRI